MEALLKRPFSSTDAPSQNTLREKNEVVEAEPSKSMANCWIMATGQAS
jgi:hypothetical protein